MNIYFKYFFALIVLSISPWVIDSLGLFYKNGICYENFFCPSFSAYLVIGQILTLILGLYYRDSSDTVMFKIGRILLMVFAGLIVAYLFMNFAPMFIQRPQLTALQTPAITSEIKSTLETNSKKSMDTVILKTNFGTIEISLFRDKAPNTVENFLKLTKSGFYDGTRFHRVIKGFMIQGGDPLSKDTAIQNRWGTGGPGYKFDDELTGQEKYPQGTLAMANSGPDTNGSQFFIVTADPQAPLPPSYTVFGKVLSGMDVVLKIEKVDTEGKGSIDRPIKEVLIEKVEVK